MNTKIEQLPLGPTPAATAAGGTIPIPDYLARNYTWAYLNGRTLPWLDRAEVVSLILWGNAGRLMRAAVAEFSPGQKVLQAACVYGDFSTMLARRVGGLGRLEVVDVAQLQVDNARRKLGRMAHARVRRADLAGEDIGVAPGTLDGVACFFLLHEVPAEARPRILDNLLTSVRVGGKVVITDYHRPHPWHPLGPVMALVFRTLEPYAASLQDQDIREMSFRGPDFEWKKTTLFGGLYQQLVATRLR